MNIRLEHATKRYGDVTVVEDLDLDIVDGEFFTLLGASGSGKTTTLRLIAGLERLDAGRLLLGERVVDAPQEGAFVPPEQRGLGMVFQSYALWPHLSVSGNLALGLEERRVPRAEITPRVAAAMGQVGLPDLLHRYPHELSGGQQQRVALARALVGEPGIMLFDEPLSNVDAAAREQVRVELRALQRRLAVTAVLVTHDQVEAMSISDRIGIINEGRIVQVGRPDDLYHRPRSTFVATFLGNANLLQGVVTGDCVRIGEADIKLAQPLATGPVTVMLRPECIAFGDGPNALVGHIRDAMLMGSLTRYDVHVPALGRELRIEATSVGAPRDGEVSISFSSEHIVPLPHRGD